MKCERCGEKAKVFRNSLYTDEMVCYNCIDEEKQHPTYEMVKRLEHEAVKRGDYNFCYGLPEDIKEKYPKYEGE